VGNSNTAQAFKKPRPDFPLFPHATGRWAKKVRGKFEYFGKCADDPTGQAALQLWLDQRDDLLAGRTPRVKGDGLTVRDLCNRFLTAKVHARDNGEIAPRTYHDYRITTDRLIEHFGKTRLVSDLAADDFAALRASIAKTRNLTTLGNEIQRCRAVFKHALEAGWINEPARYGKSFDKPTRKALRIERGKKGEMMFEAVELRALLTKATPELKAMMLLALNAGFGNNDCALLPIAAVDFERGWLTFPRPKTGVARRIPLWPETCEALKAVLARRRAPKDSANEQCVFVTLKSGNYGRDLGGGAVSKEFRRLCLDNGLGKVGRGFYTLRHVHRTIADGSRDQPACDAIMGHLRGDMASIYRERLDDDRLQAVVDHVHQWLFPVAPASDKKPAAKQSKKPADGKAKWAKVEEAAGPTLLKIFA
jgi:integrase